MGLGGALMVVWAYGDVGGGRPCFSGSFKGVSVGVWPCPGCGGYGACGLCPESRDWRVCESSSEIDSAGKLQ